MLECGSSLSDCDTIIDQVLSSRGDHGTVHSPGLVSRVERILGVNSGDRLQVIIPRDDDDLDYISEKQCSCLISSNLLCFRSSQLRG